jgi:hypothetical protein
LIISSYVYYVAFLLQHYYQKRFEVYEVFLVYQKRNGNVLQQNIDENEARFLKDFVDKCEKRYDFTTLQYQASLAKKLKT